MKYTIILLLLFLNLNAIPKNVCEYKRDIRIDYFIEQLNKESRIKEIEVSNFSYTLLLEYLNLKYPNYNKVVLKQFKLETGHFKSKIFKENNNIAGMKLPRKRKTLAIGSRYNHAYYNHWTESVRDYYYWLLYYTNKGIYVPNDSHSSYYCFLKRVGYSTSDTYINTLKQIKI